MRISTNDLAHQKQMLTIYRRNAAIQSRQVAMHQQGFVPPVILHGLREAITNIAYIKKVLVDAGHPVDSAPEDTFDFTPYGM